MNRKKDFFIYRILVVLFEFLFALSLWKNHPPCLVACNFMRFRIFLRVFWVEAVGTTKPKLLGLASLETFWGYRLYLNMQIFVVLIRFYEEYFKIDDLIRKKDRSYGFFGWKKDFSHQKLFIKSNFKRKKRMKYHLSRWIVHHFYGRKKILRQNSNFLWLKKRFFDFQYAFGCIKPQEKLIFWDFMQLLYEHLIFFR